MGIWKCSACHDSAPSDATVQKLCQISSHSISARAPARYRFASQDLKAVSCHFPGILFVFLVGEAVLWEGRPARRAQEVAVTYRSRGLVVPSEGTASLRSSYSNALWSSSDQATFEKRYVFPPTKHSPVKSVNTLLWPGFPGAGLHQLVPKNVVRTPLSRLLPFQSFRQMGHFSLSCQWPQGLNPVTRWEAIPGH